MTLGSQCRNLRERLILITFDLWIGPRSDLDDVAILLYKLRLSKRLEYEQYQY